MYGILFWTCSVSAVTFDPLLDKSIITNFTDIIQVHCTVYIQPFNIENYMYLILSLEENTP